MRRGVARENRGGCRSHRCRRDLRFGFCTFPWRATDLCPHSRRRCGGCTAHRVGAGTRCALHARRGLVGTAQPQLSPHRWRASIWRMSSDPQEVSVELLRSLTPLEGMKRENLHALAKKVTVKQLTAGRTLFKEGDADKRTIWIVRGLVEISENGRTVGMIEGGSADARAPLNQSLPRKVTARAVEDVDYLAIDSDLLDVMITWDQTGSYEVGELQATFGSGADDGDWMTTLLQTKAFHRIPPANLQAIFMRMNRQQYRAGEVVIKQGDEGDYFYAIVQGRCLVTRESPLNQKGIKLAELGVGETFGEEALIAEAKRNATVTMLSDGVLMRLNKQDFRDLMHEPLLRWVDEAQALKIILNKGQWLDVRLPSEFQNMAVENSINIPLYFVRLKLNALD